MSMPHHLPEAATGRHSWKRWVMVTLGAEMDTLVILTSRAAQERVCVHTRGASGLNSDPTASGTLP